MFSIKKKQCEASIVCGRQMGWWQPDWKAPLLSPGQHNLMNKDADEITFLEVRQLIATIFIVILAVVTTYCECDCFPLWSIQSNKINLHLLFCSVALTGDLQVSRHVARLISAQNKLDLVGKDWVARTEVDHWVSFAAKGSPQSRDSSLKDLNSALTHRTFLVGNSVTFADIAVWASLRSKFSWSNNC